MTENAQGIRVRLDVRLHMDSFRAGATWLENHDLFDPEDLIYPARVEVRAMPVQLYVQWLPVLIERARQHLRGLGMRYQFCEVRLSEEMRCVVNDLEEFDRHCSSPLDD